MVFAEGGPLRISTSEAGGGLSPEYSVDGHQPICQFLEFGIT